MNKKYIQKGLTPFHEFGNITPSQWEELSARNTELAKRNKHHHHLGPGGYYAKEEQFRKLAIKTLCAVSVTYFFSTPLHGCQKHYLTFSYAKHTVPQAEAWECTLWILYMFYDEFVRLNGRLTRLHTV